MSDRLRATPDRPNWRLRSAGVLLLALMAFSLAACGASSSYVQTPTEEPTCKMHYDDVSAKADCRVITEQRVNDEAQPIPNLFYDQYTGFWVTSQPKVGIQCNDADYVGISGPVDSSVDYDTGSGFEVPLKAPGVYKVSVVARACGNSWETCSNGSSQDMGEFCDEDESEVQVLFDNLPPNGLGLKALIKNARVNLTGIITDNYPLTPGSGLQQITVNVNGVEHNLIVSGDGSIPSVWGVPAVPGLNSVTLNALDRIGNSTALPIELGKDVLAYNPIKDILVERAELDRLGRVYLDLAIPDWNQNLLPIGAGAAAGEQETALGGMFIPSKLDCPDVVNEPLNSNIPGLTQIRIRCHAPRADGQTRVVIKFKDKVNNEFEYKLDVNAEVFSQKDRVIAILSALALSILAAAVTAGSFLGAKRIIRKGHEPKFREKVGTRQYEDSVAMMVKKEVQPSPKNAWMIEGALLTDCMRALAGLSSYPRMKNTHILSDIELAKSLIILNPERTRQYLEAMQLKRPTENYLAVNSKGLLQVKRAALLFDLYVQLDGLSQSQVRSGRIEDNFLEHLPMICESLENLSITLTEVISDPRGTKINALIQEGSPEYRLLTQVRAITQERGNWLDHKLRDVNGDLLKANSKLAGQLIRVRAVTKRLHEQIETLDVLIACKKELIFQPKYLDQCTKKELTMIIETLYRLGLKTEVEVVITKIADTTMRRRMQLAHERLKIS